MSLPVPDAPSPDGWVAVVTDLPQAQSQRLAVAAVEFARQMAPRVSGRGARGFLPASGEGWFGIFSREGYMMFQNEGTRPRVMRELAGKAQPLDEPVLTPWGWRPMGSLSVGDLVIGSDGAPTPVVGIYPQGAMECCVVTFKDGTSVRCSPDHLWTVRRTNSGTGRWETRTTDYLMERPQVGWALPVVGPVQFDGLSSLPLDPYIVGALIGDGYLGGSSPALSADGPAVPREVAALLPPGVFISEPANRDSLSWVIAAGRRGTRSNPVSRALAEIGLKGCTSHDKFLPPTYMAASVEDRVSLLQGLMDTDGSTSADGFLRYSTVSEVLAQDVANLVRGLGGIASVSPPGHTWTIAIRLPEGVSPYRADQQRKRRYDAPRARRAMSKAIRSIHVEEAVEMQCIRVAAEDSLYVTSGYSLTHNTIPMWITDEDGSMTAGVPAEKRGERTRVTDDGRRQVLIFRKAAPIGSTKTRRSARGRLITVPRAYPGALRRGPHGYFQGVHWRHPGLRGRQFAQDALAVTADRAGVEIVDLYPSRIGA